MRKLAAVALLLASACSPLCTTPEGNPGFPRVAQDMVWQVDRAVPALANLMLADLRVGDVRASWAPLWRALFDLGAAHAAAMSAIDAGEMPTQTALGQLLGAYCAFRREAGARGVDLPDVPIVGC